MKRFIVLLSFVVLLFVSSSCSRGERERLTLYVASETRLACYGVSTGETLVVRTSHTEKWDFLYVGPRAGIKGFNFEMGYEYKIRVLHITRNIEDVLMDESADEYKLISVISKEKKKSEDMPGHNCTQETLDRYCNFMDEYFFDKENSKVNYVLE